MATVYKIVVKFPYGIYLDNNLEKMLMAFTGKFQISMKSKDSREYIAYTRHRLDTNQLKGGFPAFLSLVAAHNLCGELTWVPDYRTSLEVVVNIVYVNPPVDPEEED